MKTYARVHAITNTCTHTLSATCSCIFMLIGRRPASIWLLQHLLSFAGRTCKRANAWQKSSLFHGWLFKVA